MSSNEKDSEKNKHAIDSSVHRRQILRAVGAGTALSSTAGIVSANRDTIEVPVAYQGDEVYKTRTVSADWWEDVQYVERIHENAAEQFNSMDNVISVSIVPSATQIDGHVKMELRVSHNESVNEDLIESQIPNTYKGVNIRRNAISKDTEMSCSLDEEYSPVPGSVVVNAGSTLCGRAEYVGSETVVVTTGHSFDACDSSPTGESAYQANSEGDSSREIGEVIAYNAANDWAAIDTNGSGNLDITGDLIIEDGSQPELVGSYTSYSNLIDQGTTVYKAGIAWGHRSGQCVSYNETKENFDCNDLGGNGVETTMNVGKGDSGGPQYILSGSDNDPLLVAMTTHGRGDPIEDSPCRNTHSEEHTLGISSEELNNNGLEFWV